MGQQPHKLISSSVGRAVQLWRGVRTFPASSVLFACSESSSVKSIMLWQTVSLLLSPVLKRQIQSILFYFVMFRKYFHKRRECWKNRWMLSDLITCRLISQRYCCNGEDLTKANLLKVLHINSRSVIFMSRDYVVFFLLENTFFSESFYCVR